MTSKPVFDLILQPQFKGFLIPRQQNPFYESDGRTPSNAVARKGRLADLLASYFERLGFPLARHLQNDSRFHAKDVIEIFPARPVGKKYVHLQSSLNPNQQWEINPDGDDASPWTRNIDWMACCTVQVRRVVETSMPTRRPTSQNPESLTWEANTEPFSKDFDLVHVLMIAIDSMQAYEGQRADHTALLRMESEDQSRWRFLYQAD